MNSHLSFDRRVHVHKSITLQADCTIAGTVRVFEEDFMGVLVARAHRAAGHRTALQHARSTFVLVFLL